MLKAVGRKSGRDVCEFTLQTAGAASRVVLLPDVTELRADGRDICHIEFCLVDDKGVAEVSSFENAIRVGVRLAKYRSGHPF